MTTPLSKTLKRELEIKEQRYIVTLTPASLKVTRKGHRKGTELRWEDLVSGDAALALALSASVAGSRVPTDSSKSRKQR
jgi:hypothetical protein